jgi:hypothetical protein
MDKLSREYKLLKTERFIIIPGHCDRCKNNFKIIHSFIPDTGKFYLVDYLNLCTTCAKDTLGFIYENEN